MILLYNETKTISKVLRLLLFSIATSFCFYAQEDRAQEDIDDILDEIFFSDEQFVDELLENSSFNFLYTSINYNNNTYFSGRSSGTDQFNLIPQVSYYHSSGFNASITGVYYEDFEPNWDFTSATLGYLNTVGKNDNIICNVGYTRFFYKDDFNDFTNAVDISLGIRNKKQTLGFTLSGSYIFGAAVSYQLVSSSFARINLLRKSKYALRLRPTLHFIIAQQEYSYEEVVRVKSRRIVNAIAVEIFNLLNTQIAVPLSFTINSLEVELGYYINIPNPIANETGLPSTNFFNFSLGYLFDLNK